VFLIHDKVSPTGRWRSNLSSTLDLAPTILPTALLPRLDTFLPSEENSHIARKKSRQTLVLVLPRSLPLAALLDVLLTETCSCFLQRAVNHLLLGFLSLRRHPLFRGKPHPSIFEPSSHPSIHLSVTSCMLLLHPQYRRLSPVRVLKGGITSPIDPLSLVSNFVPLHRVSNSTSSHPSVFIVGYATPALSRYRRFSTTSPQTRDSHRSTPHPWPYNLVILASRI
jgi:hypothetical protein